MLVLPSSGPGTITNIADVSGPIGDPDPDNNTDSDTATVRDQTDVAIDKETVGTGVVDAGDTVAFDLTVTNNGPSDADRVIVHDELPTGTTAVSVTPPDGEGWVCAAVARQVTCARATLPADVGAGAPTTSVIRVVARVAASVPDGTVLTNTATVSTATPGDDPDNNTATSTVEVETSADLALTKTHDGGDEPVRAGTTTTFTIAVENDGPSDAQGPLTVTDTLPRRPLVRLGGGTVGVRRERRRRAGRRLRDARRVTARGRRLGRSTRGHRGRRRARPTPASTPTPRRWSPRPPTPTRTTTPTPHRSGWCSPRTCRSSRRTATRARR